MLDALEQAELISEQAIGTTEDGEEVLQMLPNPGVNIDVIGPINRVTGYDDSGEPIVQTYPEWHVNVRCGDLTEEQQAELAFAVITPPETPYRVWA